MSRIHTTVSGHRIEFDTTPRVARFLVTLELQVADPRVTEQAMIGLVYSTENPILDGNVQPGRAVVTKEILADPLYAVMSDLLFRKRIAQDGMDVEKLAARYSVSVAAAATKLGIHESAVRQAIAAGRLVSWMKEGRHYLDPRQIDRLAVGTRRPPKKAPAPSPADAPMGARLELCVGQGPGGSLSLRSATPVTHVERVGPNMKRGELEPGWKRLAVRTTGAKGSVRTWILTPSTETNEIRFGELYVRGPFEVELQSSTPKKAETLWRSAQAE